MEPSSRWRVWAAVMRTWRHARPARLAWSLVLIGVFAGATAGVALVAADGAEQASRVRRHRPGKRRARRTVIASQATIRAVGVVVGVPLGLVVGRAGWRWVARSVPFLYRAPFAVVAVVAVVPAALVLANVLAGLAARAAGRVRTAEILRSE